MLNSSILQKIELYHHVLLMKFKIIISYKKSGEKWSEVEDFFVPLHLQSHIIKDTHAILR